MDFPNFRVDGKVALLTGAGRGIGLAMAQALTAAGAAVVIQDIDVDVAQRQAKAINQQGGRAIALGGDLTDLSLPEQIVKQTVAQLGRLDILINNCSIQQRQHWQTETTANMQKQLDADLISPILFCQHAVPHMQAGKWGRIINMGSIQGRRANAEMVAYSLSKVAMPKLTMALARDLGKYHITVNCIAPGWIANTWRNRDDFPTPEDTVNKSKFIPLRRIGQPEDMAGITILLCSEAGNYITGQTIYVDGGMSAQ